MSRPILLAHRGWPGRYPENSRVGIARPVSGFDVRELTAVSIHEAARFGGQFAGELLPALADVVALLQDWPKAKAFVEIKRESAEAHGVDATVALVLDVLAPVPERCVVISFVERAVMTARRLGASCLRHRRCFGAGRGSGEAMKSRRSSTPSTCSSEVCGSSRA